MQFFYDSGNIACDVSGRVRGAVHQRRGAADLYGKSILRSICHTWQACVLLSTEDRVSKGLFCQCLRIFLQAFFSARRFLV